MEGGILEDEEVSMVDVLHEDDELEEEARAVLGDSDDQHCTYLSGYVKRQALYACSTCVTPDEADPGGICLACSFACHEGHTLYELYTKRNFRCDCGNKKFGNLKCKLYSHKDPENTGNKYNQNFRGIYCTCHRPYPDLEDEIEDEMIQCIVCEDWYHSRHLGNLPPAGGDFQEMICDGCMKKCSFLQAYLSISIPHQQSSIGPSQQVVRKHESEVTLDVIQPNHSEKTAKEEIKDKGGKMEEQKPSGKELSQQEPRKNESEKPLSTTKVKPMSANKEEISNHKHEVKEEQPANGESSDNTPSDCKLVQLQDSLTNITEETSYWHTGWRANLCICTKCIALYKSLDVSFLPDETDTMLAYEQRGRAKRPNTSSYESGMQALQNMGRIPQVEVMHEYNDLKTELTEYLREFAQQGKVVKEEDIRQFFDSLQSRKRQRVGSAGTVQYNCR